MNNIVFVCLGNICRSPMAEGLFRQALPGKSVCSAGISALTGEPADPLAIRLMGEHGIDIRTHRARNLATWMVTEADLILTMDQDQKRFVELKYPAAKSKVFRLGQFGGYDIPDPYRQDLAAFRYSCNLIAQGVDELIEYMASVNSQTSHYGLAAIRPPPQSLPR